MYKYYLYHRYISVQNEFAVLFSRESIGKCFFLINCHLTVMYVATL